jgi:hypothetical protein
MILHRFHDGSVGAEYEVGDLVRLKPMDLKLLDKHDLRSRADFKKIGRVNAVDKNRGPIPRNWQFHYIRVEWLEDFSGWPSFPAYQLEPAFKMRCVLEPE